MPNLPYRFLIILIVFPLLLNGCATVPKETVELSYTMGQDLGAVHASYQSLIHKHFDSLRSQTNDFFVKEWTPNYLSKFIKKGNLVSLAQNPDPAKAYEDVSVWVEIAMGAIQKKKEELIAPIDNDEQTVLTTVDDAFTRLTRANAAITAQLNSIRKVQEVQDDDLKALNLKDLRDQINTQLISASTKAESAIEQVKKADNVVKDADEKKQEFMNKIKGGK